VNNLKPVYWHQGLFLQPQHFQLADQYNRAQIQPLIRHMHPHFWGVAEYSIVESALSNRSCEMNSGEFLFSDGTYVTLPGDAVISSRTFDADWLDIDKPFTIFIGLRKLNQQEQNVTVLNDLERTHDVNTRYVSLTDPEEVNDMYSGDSIANVKKLTHVLHIIWENELEKYEDYMLIPIARVVRKESEIVFDKTFYPPVLSLNSSVELTSLIKEIRDDITGRMMQLSSYDSDETDASSHYDATLMRYKLAARTLSRHIPRLFHYTDEGSIHPWEVYGLLGELIGEISTFTKTINVLGETPDGVSLFPSYNHKDIGSCFNAAKDLLGKLLNEITIGPQFLVEMPLKGNIFTADIPVKFLEQNVDFYIIVSSSTSFKTQQQSLLTMAKVAASDRIEVLVERSLPGIGLIHAPIPPAEMPRRPDSQYVRLDNHCDEWQSVERFKDIALLWDEAPEDAKIELVIVRR
jgi:type VI secretion system protein ImpJ